MVIQRSWRTSSQSIESSSVHQTSSSEDSNSSWQTVSNSTSSSHQRNGSQTNLSSSKISHTEMAESVLKALKLRYNGRGSSQQITHEIAQNSMELMRLNVQELFDKEIELIVQKYTETYFKPALKNVKENLDDTGITNDILAKVSCDLLENAKQQYFPAIEATTAIKIEPGTTIKTEYVQVYDHSMFSYKTAPCKRKDSSSSSSEMSGSDQSPTHHSIKRLSTNFHIKTINRPKHVLWNVANLTSDTLFALDYKANRSLGFSEKERLASLHPELIRYLLDNQDKDWLIQQRVLSPSHKHFRILLLVYDEVCKIAQSDEYRTRSNLKLNELNGFKISEFMLQKMKTFFHELSQKSQNLLSSPQLVPANSTISLSTIATTAPTMIAQTSVTSTTPSPTHVLLVDTSVHGPTQRAIIQKAPTTRAFIATGRSSLSSSHATLSALLSNTADTNFNSNNEVAE